MPYPKCYIAEGCGGDEACAALCPDVRRPERNDSSEPDWMHDAEKPWGLANKPTDSGADRG